MNNYIMAIDQGTTSSRTILFDKGGNVICQVSKEFTQIFPKLGWVEHDPEEIWQTQLFTMKAVIKKSNIKVSRVEAIGITNQRETTVVWDKTTGRPVYNAIVWQCRRTADIVDGLVKDGYSDMIKEKTGLLPDAYFSGTKIKWILDHVEGARQKAENGDLLFGTIDTYLMWKLSGGKIFATDYTNASRTMLYNIKDLCWDEELLKILDIPKTMLPTVKPSSGFFGDVDMSLLDSEGQKPIPICGVAGDQQAALFGQCCFEKGDVKNTYGTGCFLLMNTGDQPVYSKNGLVTTIAASTDEVQYALEGSVFIAGAAIQWLRDKMGLISTALESEEVAGKVEDSDGVYVVPAFTGLGAPYWKQNAKGIVVGITRGTCREHFVRATLESLAYETLDVINAMEEDLGDKINSLKVDGGASRNNLLMQFQSDIIEKDVIRPKMVETTALGAAYLAGLASDYWKDKDDIQKNIAIERTFTPAMEEEKVEEKLKGWRQAIRCAIAYTEE